MSTHQAPSSIDTTYVAVLVHSPWARARHRPRRQCLLWLHLPFACRSHAKNTHAAALSMFVFPTSSATSFTNLTSTFSSSSSSPRTAPTAFLRLAFMKGWDASWHRHCHASILSGLLLDAPSTVELKRVLPESEAPAHQHRSRESAQGSSPFRLRAR